jgi:hypothetical protein
MATAESVKAKIQGLINVANDTTGANDTDLTTAVNKLVAGYGASGGSEEEFNLTPYIESVIVSTDIQEITEDITLHLERATSLSQTFLNKVINAPKITIYISDKCTSLYRIMRGAGSTVKIIEIIGDTSNVTTYMESFSGKSTAEQIICDFNFSSATNVTIPFNGCAKLVEVRFVPNTLFLNFNISSSPLLSDASIQSIIDCLVDMTEDTTKTLTLHKDVKAKLTETQIATITNKNWTLA